MQAARCIGCETYIEGYKRPWGCEIRINTEVGAVGAEILDVKLNRLSSAEREQIRAAWHKYHVLFFRDQDLSPPEQAEFAADFGDLDVYPFVKAIDAHPNVIPIVKEKDDTMNFGGGWHTDTSYIEKPPMATVLYGVEIPKQGGDTMFADCTAAFEDLSPAMQEVLVGLTGIYSAKLVHGKGGPYNHVAQISTADDTEMNGEQVEEDDPEILAEVEHPLIRRHPDTGRLSIFCSRYHTVRIKGWTREESIPLIHFLEDHATQDKYTTRFKWQNGSIAFWDNRCLYHNALNDYQGHRRHMRRVIIQGEKPEFQQEFQQSA